MATETLRTVCNRDCPDACGLVATVEDGRLYLLQSRAGKRSALAALRILLALHDEGVIDGATALTRAEALDPASLVVARVVAEDGNGLILRRSTPTDSPALSEFNARIHPEECLRFLLLR